MKFFLSILLIISTTMIYGQNTALGLVDTEFTIGNYSKVIKIVNRVNDNNSYPDSIKAVLLEYKARSYGAIRNYDSMFYACLEIYKKYPKNLYASLELGHFYANSGDYENAFYLFQNIRKFYPLHVSAVVNLAFYNNQKGSYKLGILYSDTTLLLSQDSITTGVGWNNRCYANLKLGNLSLAKQELAKAMLYYPNNSYAFLSKALILLKEERIEEACQALEHAKTLGGVNITEELRSTHCTE